ncbi:type I secretion system permease/ATPase, partial [Ralstonia solanacearum]|uniref:type I secretion system permease/ATPase n=1 Tax=Ralstonia solanacearum TaxID=305 RepID=UPI002029FDD9
LTQQRDDPCNGLISVSLGSLPGPALMFDAAGRHFALVGVEGDEAHVWEPGVRHPSKIAITDVVSRSNGKVMLVASRAPSFDTSATFDFSWFIPSIVRYRRLFGEVLFVSLVIQLVGLVAPLMYQAVMDKAIPSRSYDTLSIVSIALLLSYTFEAALTAARGYVLSHTTNRVDVELGSKLIRHLLRLPLDYFDARRVGDTASNARELENVRNFLTGQCLTAVIDIGFSAVFLSIMLYYSVPLTCIVLASLPLYVVLSISIGPTLQRRLKEKFARYADNQSLLMESVSAIETVKAMAIEPPFVRRWEEQLAAYVSASFRASTLINVGQQIIQLIGKLTSLGILYFGAKLVMDGRMTIGGLVAFNMFAQRVASPILRLAQLWQDFQQVGISTQRLAKILNVKSEVPARQQALTSIRGDIWIDQVTFRYRPNEAPALRGVSIKIRAGEVVGIIGRSGSGKSTLAKLLQRLYIPEQGHVFVDGVDLAMVDPAWLRRQIGVVLQESRLFNRTIRENIAVGDPGAPLDQVVHAAQLAGAHEFITQLTEGYDTMVGESGATLSGGQRQRIAIARALLKNPRILVFDEATSALDFETERIIHDNMQSICQGRTVIVIAHRLTALRRVNRVIALDGGNIIEEGPQDELRQRGGYYATLHAIQSA